jgi:hypothetical protein
VPEKFLTQKPWNAKPTGADRLLRYVGVAAALETVELVVEAAVVDVRELALQDRQYTDFLW